MEQKTKFMGYKRPDGKVGVRNYIGVIPSVFCANRVAELIANQVDGAIFLKHPVGCSQVGEDLEISCRTLIAMGNHPNIAAVLVVGLGCERFTPDEFVEGVKESGKHVEKVVIQDEGDTLKAVEKGVRIVKTMAEEVQNMEKVECDVSDLIIGVKCGGTDATSGIAANPAVGMMSDMVVNNGGSIIFSEVSELLGTEHILSKRAVNEEVRQKVMNTILNMEEKLRRIGTDPKFAKRGALISTGNFDGGVSSVVEKALGGIYKSGNGKITNVLEYATCPEKDEKGVFLMDSPGHDGEVVTGMVGGGAQIIAFTSGRGTPTGFPFVPVIKITGNDKTFNKMKENIDINAGDIIEKEVTLEEKGTEIFEKVIKVADGKKTKAEILKGDELFCITRV